MLAYPHGRNQSYRRTGRAARHVSSTQQVQLPDSQAPLPLTPLRGAAATSPRAWSRDTSSWPDRRRGSDRRCRSCRPDLTAPRVGTTEWLCLGVVEHRAARRGVSPISRLGRPVGPNVVGVEHVVVLETRERHTTGRAQVEPMTGVCRRRCNSSRSPNCPPPRWASALHPPRCPRWYSDSTFPGPGRPRSGRSHCSNNCR